MARGDLRRAAARRLRRALRSVAGHDSALRTRLPWPVLRRVEAVARRIPRGPIRQIEEALRQPADPDRWAAGSLRPQPPNTAVRLWIAPTNSAGQGRAWAKAVEEHQPGVGARNMAVLGARPFPADQQVSRDVYLDARWQRAQESYVLEHYTHVLIESGRPLFGTRHGRTCEAEIPLLRASGIEVGLLAHGSDVRIPSEHIARFRFSPFGAAGQDHSDALVRRLEVAAQRNVRLLRGFDGPVFVSTPDLLHYLPDAHWCPAVLDVDSWSAAEPLLQRRAPRVVHIPSNGPIKGTAFVDTVCGRLHEQGLIDYRTLRDLTHDEVREEYEHADIVVEQLVLGCYGVAAVEAMAAGRVVVGFFEEEARRRVREATGLEVPIIDADPTTLRAVIEGVLSDREAARTVAANGPEYARRIHDGRRSAEALSILTRDTSETGRSGR